MKFPLFFIIISFIILLNTIHTKDYVDKIIANFMTGSPESLFKVYHMLFKKDQEYFLESPRGQLKLKVFEANLKFINEQNSKNLSYTLGITPFTDLTNEEYRNIMLTKTKQFNKSIDDIYKPEFEYEKENQCIEINDDFQDVTLNILPSLNNTVNYTSLYNPVLNNWKCKTSWPYVTVAAIEGNYAIRMGNRLDLTPEYFVDCLRGCHIGLPKTALNYFNKRDIATSCKYHPFSNLLIRTKMKKCYNCNENEWVKLLKTGPIVVGLDAGSRIFQHYKSGVMELSRDDCQNVNHLAVATAYLKDEVEGQDKGYYITIRNNWGIRWGNYGYADIRYDTNTLTCLMSKYALLPTLTAKFPKYPGPPGITCPVFYEGCNWAFKSVSTCSSFKKLLNMRIQSIRVGSDANKVALYDEEECKGNVIFIDSDAKCLASSPTQSFVNDQIGSLSVLMKKYEPKEGCVLLCSSPCFGGKKVEICEAMDDLKDSDGVQLQIESIFFGKGVSSVEIYTSKEFFGYAYVLNGATGNLGQGETVDFNNNILSINVYKDKVKKNEKSEKSEKNE